MIKIYIHRNLINGKVYIGQTKNSLARRARKDGSGYKGSHAFYNAIQKYGWENFSHAIIEECEDDKANERERYWVDFFNSTNNQFGYNSMSGGKIVKKDSNYMIGVYCKETKQYFKSLSDAAEWAGLQRTSMNDISKQIEGRRLSAGHHPETNIPLHWCIKKEDCDTPNKPKTSHNAKSVIDLISQEIYISIKEATKKTGISYPTIVKNCASKDKIIKKKGKEYNFIFYN